MSDMGSQCLISFSMATRVGIRVGVGDRAGWGKVVTQSNQKVQEARVDGSPGEKPRLTQGKEGSHRRGEGLGAVWKWRAGWK